MCVDTSNCSGTCGECMSDSVRRLTMANKQLTKMCDQYLAELQRARMPENLWLWRNFVDGKPEYWAFDNPYPIHLDSHDPQTLGSPCGYAIFKPSRNGRPDVSAADVVAEVRRSLDIEQSQRARLPAELTAKLESAALIAERLDAQLIECRVLNRTDIEDIERLHFELRDILAAIEKDQQP